MDTLHFLLLFAAMLSGVAGITLDLVFFILKKEKIYLFYGLFLAGIFFFMLNTFYTYITIYRPIPRMTNYWISWGISIIGTTAFILGAPRLIHYLLTLKLPKLLRIIFYIMAAILLIPFGPSRQIGFTLFWIVISLLTIYLLTIAILFRKRISDPLLKSAMRAFTLISALLLLFILTRLIPGDFSKKVSASGINLYYILLNILSIIFAFRYYRRPPFLQNGLPTEHFILRYGITKREAEVIPMLLLGETNKEIGNALHISPKTVANHVSNIYDKLQINNRLQLANLLQNRQINL